MNKPLTLPRRSDFGLAGSIGTGQSNPGDVLRIRRALQRTGHGQFPPKPASNVTPGLMEAIEAFQDDFGLKRDGVAEPGGPTEGALRFALTALDTGGESGLAAVRDHFRRRADAGFSFRPDPDDPEAALWRDTTGRLITDEQAAEKDREGTGDTQTAMMRRRDQYTRPGERVLEGGGGGGIGLGTLGAGATLQAIMNQMFNQPQGEVTPPPKPGDFGRSERTVPLRDPPQGTPPIPTEPPFDPVHKEEYPMEERGPTILVSPIPEEAKPAIEVFPDMSDVLEHWLVLEYSRGTKEGQQKDLQFIIDTLYRAFERKGIAFKHVGGGYTAEDTPGGGGDYKKELVRQRQQGVNKGSRRADFTFELPDLNEIIDINVVDTLKDGVTPSARERRAFDAIVELKELYEHIGDTQTIGKSKGMEFDEWKMRVEFWIEEYTDAKLERIRAKND